MNPQATEQRVARSRARLQHLQMVLILAETGSVREAAQRLGLTQPAVTKALQELESLLGVPLFHRDKRGLTPTVFCAPVERFARDVMLGLEGAMQAVDGLLRGEEGRVAVGAVAGAVLQRLATETRELRARHPQLEVGLRARGTTELLAEVAEGSLDMALVPQGEGLDREEFSVQAAGRQELMCVVAPGHPLLALQPVSSLDLVQHPWALPASGDPLRELVERALGARAEAPLPVLEAEGCEAMMALARRSQAIAVLEATQAAELVEAGLLARLSTTIALPPLPLVLVVSRRRRLRATAALVYRALHQAFADAGSGLTS